jgi:iron complex transport system ATP-binding protein
VVSGTPQEVFTKEHMKTLFEIEAEILYLPKHDKPIVASYDLIKGGS